MADQYDIQGVDLKVDPGLQPGQFTAAGNLEFTDLDFEPTVRSGQELAVADSSIPEAKLLTSGSNVRVEIQEGGLRFIAEADGVFRMINNQLAVFEILGIDGDVGFETGNLQFEGSVYIKGRVNQAFSVKSGGDVIVVGNVEAGAKITASGGVYVGGDIKGLRTKVIAMGPIRTGIVNEAYTFSAHDIEVGCISERGTLRAGGSIRVNKVEDPRSGAIAGGQAWSLTGMDVHQAGTPTGTTTQLNAGLDLEHGKKLDDLNEKIETGNKQIKRLLDRMGMATIDVGQIRKRLAAAQGPKRKILAVAARQLGEIIKAHQELLGERGKIHSALEKRLTNARVKVREHVYSGVEVRIGDQNMSIRSELDGVEFFVRDDILAYESIGS